MKVLETEYKGYRFRSRLEARWAVFMDAINVPYQYEREGYDLDGFFYLPGKGKIDYKVSYLTERSNHMETTTQAPEPKPEPEPPPPPNGGK